MEVYEAKKTITPEQRAIARFWSDDAMLSVTPPGHWMSIALQILERDKVGLEKSVDVLARLGIAEADAFIGCWQAKYEYDLVRPITYIRRVIDPKWETHRQHAAVSRISERPQHAIGRRGDGPDRLFGDNFAFDDDTGRGRRAEAAHLPELLGGGRRGRHLAGSMAASTFAPRSSAAWSRGAASAPMPSP